MALKTVANATYFVLFSDGKPHIITVVSPMYHSSFGRAFDSVWTLTLWWEHTSCPWLQMHCLCIDVTVSCDCICRRWPPARVCRCSLVTCRGLWVHANSAPTSPSLAQSPGLASSLTPKLDSARYAMHNIKISVLMVPSAIRCQWCLFGYLSQMFFWHWQTL